MNYVNKLETIAEKLKEIGIESSVWNSGGNIYVLTLQDEERNIDITFGYPAGVLGYQATDLKGNPLKNKKNYGNMQLDKEYAEQEEFQFVTNVLHYFGILMHYVFRVNVYSSRKWSNTMLGAFEDWLWENTEEFSQHYNAKISIKQTGVFEND